MKDEGDPPRWGEIEGNWTILGTAAALRHILFAEHISIGGKKRQQIHFGDFYIFFLVFYSVYINNPILAVDMEDGRSDTFSDVNMVDTGYVKAATDSVLPQEVECCNSMLRLLETLKERIELYRDRRDMLVRRMLNPLLWTKLLLPAVQRAHPPAPVMLFDSGESVDRGAQVPAVPIMDVVGMLHELERWVLLGHTSATAAAQVRDCRSVLMRFFELEGDAVPMSLPSELSGANLAHGEVLVYDLADDTHVPGVNIEEEIRKAHLPQSLSASYSKITRDYDELRKRAVAASKVITAQQREWEKIKTALDRLYRRLNVVGAPMAAHDPEHPSSSSGLDVTDMADHIVKRAAQYVSTRVESIRELHAEYQGIRDCCLVFSHTLVAKNNPWNWSPQVIQQAEEIATYVQKIRTALYD